MDETLISVVIGGSISIAAQALTTVFNAWQQHRREKHDYAMRVVDLAEAKRMECLQDFADQLGAFVAPGYSSTHDPEHLLAAAQKVALYVDADTLSAINVVLPLLTRDQGKRLELPERVALLKTPEFACLTKCLRREMRSSFDTIKSPQRKAK